MGSGLTREVPYMSPLKQYSDPGGGVYYYSHPILEKYSDPWIDVSVYLYPLNKSLSKVRQLPPTSVIPAFHWSLLGMNCLDFVNFAFFLLCLWVLLPSGKFQCHLCYLGAIFISGFLSLHSC